MFKSDDYAVRARIFLDEKMGSGFLQNIDQNYAERILNLTKRYFLVLGSKNENDRKQYLINTNPFLKMEENQNG